LASSPAVWGQGGAYSEVTGTVRDPAGAIIIGAKVSAQNVSTNLERSVTSDNNGFFRINLLPPGKYEITVESPGFARFVQGPIELTIGQTATLDVVLKVGSPEEILEVTAEAPLVDTTRTEVSQVVGLRQIQGLPINGRSFIDFTLLTPSVAIGRANVGGLDPIPDPGLRISFAGMREVFNNVMVDGADNNAYIVGLPRATPSQEAVQEFRVINNSFNAEFGRATGGVLNVITRSGSNEFHGTAYLFFRNDALDARSILTSPGFDELRQNQFGFSLAGPIQKDRVFFFGNYEGQRRGESPIYSQFILDNIGAINAIKNSFGLPSENLGVLRVVNYDQFLVRTDVQVTAKHNLSARYNFRDDVQRNQTQLVGGRSAPSAFRNFFIRDQSLVSNITTILSLRWVNEARFQYARRSFGNPSVSGEPYLNIPNLLDIGRNPGINNFNGETRLEFADNVSYSRGTHNLKFGLNINYVRSLTINPWATPVWVVFPSPAFFFGIPTRDFPFLDRPTPAFVVFGVAPPPAPIPPPRSTDFANTPAFPPEAEQIARGKLNTTFFDFYGQDQWRAARNLTLTYGLRYSFQRQPRELVKGDFNNFQPRFGFVYTIGQEHKTVIRGGFGIFHGNLNGNNLVNQLVAGGSSVLRGFEDFLSRRDASWTAFGFIFPVSASVFNDFVRAGRYPPVRGPELVPTRLAHDFPNPYSEQANLQVEYEVTKDLVVSVGYLFNHGLKLDRLVNLSKKPATQFLPNGKPFFTELTDPRFFLYQAAIPVGNSLYHGGTASVTKRFSQHFSFGANYTFSRTIDDVAGISINGVADNTFDLRLERALSGQHVAHRFVANFLAEGPRQTFLRNFTFSTIVTLESPRFYTVFAGFDTNNDNNPVSDRVGTLARNTFQGDNFRSVDIRLSRKVHFTERVHAEFLAEVFNLFNTTNVTDIDTTYGAPDLIGSAPRKFGEPVVAPSPSFGTPLAVANPRQVQIAVKIRF